MSDPVFKDGDEVEYELRAAQDFPRWDFQEDRGGSGVWETGKVTNFNIRNNEVTIIMPNGNWWCWPLKGNGRYSPDQWDKPGYLRLKNQGKFGKYSGKTKLIDKGGYFCTEEC
jgi:hypothetical protein